MGTREGREGRLTSKVLLNLIKLLASFFLSFSHRAIRLGNELDILLSRHQRDHVPQNRTRKGRRRKLVSLSSPRRKEGRANMGSVQSEAEVDIVAGRGCIGLSR